MTPAENKCLTLALERGYERPFRVPVSKALLSLEDQGLIESNSCGGYPKEWRITQKGLSEYELV